MGDKNCSMTNSSRYTGIQLLDRRMSLRSAIHSTGGGFTIGLHLSYSVALALKKL